MELGSVQTSSPPPPQSPDVKSPDLATPKQNNPAPESPFRVAPSGTSSWAKHFRFPQPVPPPQRNSPAGNAGESSFARLTSGLGLRLPTMPSGPNESQGTSTTAQGGVFESITKGLVDSSRSAVKAMQVKARHIVSQNKRRYQEGGFDLDLTYITENIIAMGFPAGDSSSGFFFGYVEGLYRNHMEEVIKFLETQHKGKYKVYNLCSERLYDASLFQGKVGCFPFNDHNCPPLQLISSFCQSAYSWLKDDIQNVVVVHCKAGMARTGLMICSLLLYFKFFPTPEEAIDYYNQKRCIDGKALVLPSQIRYVKYFQRVLTDFNGEDQPGRRCMLRGFRLHKCPYWVRPAITISNHGGILFSTKKHSKTKDLMPEDFWISASKKGIMVFALPGEPGLTELAGDFKIHFHDRQGDFYCWLNTNMIENRTVLSSSELDGFHKRKLPSPGFQVEIVMIDYDGTLPAKQKPDSDSVKQPDGTSGPVPTQSDDGVAPNSHQSKVTGGEENDDVFSDSEGEENEKSKSRQVQAATSGLSSATSDNDHIGTLTHQTEQLSFGNKEPDQSNAAEEHSSSLDAKSTSSLGISNSTSQGYASDIKAMAADASVFTFGDEEDYESD